MATSTAQHHVPHNMQHHTSRTTRRPRLGSFQFGPRYNEGYISVSRSEPCPMPLLNPREFKLYYRVYNPSSLHSTESPPLLIVHGGPSLPSNYLYPLVDHFPTSRSIIFYDQLGCGRSNCPADKEMYSIENAVQDLQEIIVSLHLDKFHLLGHSFGGIVAYEYAKSEYSKCLSLTLDSTPSNMKTSLEEVHRLEDEVKNELVGDEGEKDSQDVSKLIQDRLRRRNELRTDKMPDSLATAIESRGTTFGPESVADYVAYPPSSHTLPPVLLIRGQYDFVTEKCIEGWREIFTHQENSSPTRTSYREEEMSNCAHYCHLEDASSFGDLIKSHIFINDY